MTRTEALPLARNIAAAVHELNGDAPDYCTFMREGAYDGDHVVQAAIAGLVIGARKAREAARPIEAAPTPLHSVDEAA